MAEGRQAGVAEQQVVAEREDHPDQDLGPEVVVQADGFDPQRQGAEDGEGQQDRRGDPGGGLLDAIVRSEEHTSELQSLMRISYAVFCLKKKTKKLSPRTTHT